MAKMYETYYGPNYSVKFWEPDPYASMKYDSDSGWHGPKAGATLSRAEFNTFQYKAHGYGMPLADYHSYGAEGPHMRSKFGVSTSGIDGRAELSAGKITGDVGRLRTELNPNLTTAVTYGMNGMETRVGGMGATVNRKGMNFHTPIGSIGWRW